MISERGFLTERKLYTEIMFSKSGANRESGFDREKTYEEIRNWRKGRVVLNPQLRN